MTRLIVDASVAIKWVVPEEHSDAAYSLLDRSFYDSLYLALAVSDSCPLVTADRRLYNALRTAPDFDLVWIGDVT